MKKNLVISDQNKPLTEQDIRDFESRIGAVLPSEYREFILQNNGGEPSVSIFPLPDNPLDDHAILNRFLCIEEGDMYDILYMKDILESRLPGNLMPIAIDPGGNLICLGVRGAEYSKIYFCSLDESEIGEILVYPIANSFSEFLESLDD